ncbi:LuxR C-terminal-related transcriptional regulator [Roseateles sp. DXS20W]|uniref:LuxR C-terminal-related transcriptional regulator n=1 Tax=Pelomonas lactea TaxID=3299030 RepID=A0ABW7GJD4_9BURK
MTDSTSCTRPQLPVKLCPPRPQLHTLVAREQLGGMLGRELATRRVVLVQAAAGYGKSLAVAQALEMLPPQLIKVWINLDEGDSLRSIAHGLSQALEPYDPPWTSDPCAWANNVIAGDKGSLIAESAEFVRALQGVEAPSAVLVFDDLHRLQQESALGIVQLLAERLGHRWTVVLVSRSRPSFSVARLAASSDLAIFREADLALGQDETLSMCASLPSDRAQAIWRRTAGWPAGVRLAMAASAVDARDDAIDESVFDFLASEVIEQLPRDMRRLLLQLACLPEFNLAQAEAFTGSADAPQLLEEATRRSLFISHLGDDKGTLRFHDLFRAALLRHIRFEPDLELPALMRRAAEHEADPARRIDFFIKANAWQEAAAELFRQAPAYLLQAEADELEGLLRKFPDQQRTAMPDLLAVQGLIALSRWQWPDVPPLMRRASELYENEQRRADSLQTKSLIPIALAGLGENQSARALVRQLDEAGGLSEQARLYLGIARSWILLSEGALEATGECLTATVDCLNDMDAPPFLWQQAQPLPAFIGLPNSRGAISRWVQGSLRRSGDVPTTLRGMAQVLRAWLLLRAGDSDGAWEACEDAASECSWLHQPRALAFQLGLLKAQLLSVDGRHEALETQLNTMLVSAEMGEERASSFAARGLLLYLGCRLASQAGHTALASRLASQLLREPDVMVGWIHADLLHGIRAIAAEARGEMQIALSHWQLQLDIEGRSDLFGQGAEARIHAATLAHAVHGPGAAEVILGPLLDQCIANGEPGLLLFASPHARRYIATASWSPGFAERWAALMPGRPSAPNTLTLASANLNDIDRPSRSVDRMAGLSTREIEVLDRLAAGDSNKQIAREFDISPFTIKRHVGNILNKLGVQSRGQAAAWYRKQSN